MHVAEAQRTLGSEITWICDTMDNELKHAIGNAPNSEYVLNREAKIARMRDWSNPAELRKDLEELVGPVATPTKVADLDLKVVEPPKHAPTGIVPKLQVLGYKALKAEPQLEKSKAPFYVKLRAEAEKSFFEKGRGKVYLGFHLDPLYGVHWNNTVVPVEFEFFPPEGTIISPRKAQGPMVTEESDADPREFLLLVDRGESAEPVRMSFRYFACTEKMCIPVTQEYLINWEADLDAGDPPGRWDRPRPGPGGIPPGFLERPMDSDVNGDGKLSKDEAPPPVRRRFDRMDANSDGFLDQEEVEALRQRAAQREPGAPRQ
ncbi:MAG: hypothetical protein GY953_54850 [bacterium]|nr:hypothetical protein [bacterium]